MRRSSRWRSFRASSIPIRIIHFAGVDLQIFNGDMTPTRVATMQGFVKSYFAQRRDVQHSRKIMYYFTPDKLPVLDDARDGVRGVQSLVLVDPRTDLVQSRVRPLRLVVRSRRHGSVLPEYAVQEHLSAARGGRQDSEDLLLRHEELLVGSGQSPAAPAAVFRDVPAVSEGLQQRHAARLLVRRTELQRPRRGQRRRARLRPASRSSRAGGRAVHRGGLQRHPAERRAVGSRPRC